MARLVISRLELKRILSKRLFHIDERKVFLEMLTSLCLLAAPLRTTYVQSHVRENSSNLAPAYSPKLKFQALISLGLFPTELHVIIYSVFQRRYCILGWALHKVSDILLAIRLLLCSSVFITRKMDTGSRRLRDGDSNFAVLPPRATP